jgi:hypothetical protein
MVTLKKLVPKDHLLRKRAEVANFTNKVILVPRLVWHGGCDIIINLIKYNRIRLLIRLGELLAY